jgi:hypothetical protein
VSEVRPGCYSSVVMHNPDTCHCKSCPLFAACAVAVVETRKRLDELLVTCKTAWPSKRVRKSKIPIVIPDEVEIVLPDATPPPELMSVTHAIAAPPNPEPEVIVSADEPIVDTSAEPVAKSDTSTPAPETVTIDGIYVELAALKVNPRKKLLSWAKRGVKLRALQRGENPFAEGEGFMRVACKLLLERKTFPRTTLETALVEELKWTDGAAKSHRLIVVDTLKACGLIDYNPHGDILTLREH